MSFDDTWQFDPRYNGELEKEKEILASPSPDQVKIRRLERHLAERLDVIGELQAELDADSLAIMAHRDHSHRLFERLNQELLPWVIELAVMEKITTSKAKELIQIWNPNYTFAEAREAIFERDREEFNAG